MAKVLQDISKQYNQPAIAAALVINDEIIAKATVGKTVFNEDQVVHKDSRFHIGSTTKSMTALLIAMLVRDGKLRYEMTLEQALPDMEMLEVYRNVTLHDLLLNKAGIIPFQLISDEDPEIVQKLWGEIPLQYSDPTDQRIEVSKVVLNIKPVADPGTKVIYSNVGWAIAGLIAELAAEQSYEDLLEQKIFKPLGMNTVRIGGWPASDAEPDQPRGHYVDPENHGILKPQPLDDTYVFPSWMNPSGGVHCSIEDFAVYARENLLGLQGKGQLLNADDYKTIHSVQVTANLKEMYPSMKMDHQMTFGYGWAVIPSDNSNISAADGSGGTFFARIIVFPALDVAFVGFTNSGDGTQALDAVIEKVSGLQWKS
jgi:CubicO group peptidase (beta-lactamase class C family)